MFSDFNHYFSSIFVSLLFVLCSVSLIRIDILDHTWQLALILFYYFIRITNNLKTSLVEQRQDIVQFCSMGLAVL